MQSLLFIAAGGAIGAVLRYLVSETAFKIAGAGFPWGTMTANLIGCFIIGIMWGVFDAFNFGTNARMFVFVGILGAFTTFSTFAIDNFALLKEGQMHLLTANILISNIVGIALVFAGISLSSSIINR